VTVIELFIQENVVLYDVSEVKLKDVMNSFCKYDSSYSSCTVCTNVGFNFSP